MGETLTLRPWHDEDAAALVTAFAGVGMASQAGRPVHTEDDARQWMGGWVRAAEEGSGFAFAVDRGGEVVGNVAIAAIERRHDTGWVSYWTTAHARRQGIATMAAATLAEWAFGQLGLFRLELGHRSDNQASCRVAAAAGFRFEGVARSKLRYGETRYDVELHARLADDSRPPTATGTVVEI